MVVTDGKRPAGQVNSDQPTWRTSRLQHRSDWFTLVGAMLCGSVVLGPIGLPVLIYGIVLYRKAERAGELTRPRTMSVVMLFILVDAALNYVAWGIDLFPSHDTALGLTWWAGLGRTLDAAYYIDYNTTHLGGTAFVAEKALQIGCVLMLFPMRIAGAWALLQFRRWGHQVVIMTSWGYILVWVVWLSQLAMGWDQRMAHSLYGWFGYLTLCVLGFLGAFVTLPYLYSIDTRTWD